MAPSARPVMVSWKKLSNRNAKSTAFPSGGCAERLRPGSPPAATDAAVLAGTVLRDRRRVRRVELPVLDGVGEDRRLLDVAVLVERDRAADAGTGVGTDEGVHVSGTRLPGGDTGQEDVGRVVRLGGVEARVGAHHGLVLGVEVGRRRTRGSGQDRAVGGLGTSGLDERRVL